MAKIAGVSVRTVQYYDQCGLLVPTAQSEGGRRLYSEKDLSKMKTICFLRDLDFSIKDIAYLMREEDFDRVLLLLLKQQREKLNREIEEKRAQLARIEEMQSHIERGTLSSVESIGDIAHTMENKKKLHKVYAMILAIGIPLAFLQIGSILLWIFTGIFWPFIVWAVTVVPLAVWISLYYLKNIAYICPTCNEIFQPKFKEAFFAYHTPRTRRLVCPKCGVKGNCVETHVDALKK